MSEPEFNDPNSEVYAYAIDFMAKYGQNFRMFKHGAFHGVIIGVLLILPVIGTM